MDLLFDCGNTRLKWVLMDADGEIHARGMDPGFEPPQLPPEQTPARIAIASVREGEAVSALYDWANARLPGAVVRLETPVERDGLRIAYAEPARLGVDRWLAMLGAWQADRHAFLLVDAGTAVTIDLVDDDGRHLGGAILPGLDLMASALVGRAGGIRPRPGDATSGFPGRDTGAAVHAGALMAVRGAIRDAQAFATGKGIPARLLMTGGAAETLAAGLGDLNPGIEPELVFRGMRGMLPCCG